MQLVISTQVCENYAWNEDGSIGTGANAYWKAKGGEEYLIQNVPLNVDYEMIVAMAAVEQDNDYFRETVIGWEVVSDSYMPQFEEDQLEFEGIIRYKCPRVEYKELLDQYTDPMEYANQSADMDAEAYGTF